MHNLPHKVTLKFNYFELKENGEKAFAKSNIVSINIIEIY